MARGATLAGSRLNIVGGVEPFVRAYARSNLGVTIETLESALAAQSMAGRAVRRAVQRLVRAREGAGRNLPSQFSR